MTPDGVLDARTYRVLAGVSRVRILEFLRAQPAPVPASTIAGRVTLHPNTVRLHLDQLVEAGLVERRPEPRSGPGRPRLLFAARPVAARPASGADDGYRALAGILAGQLEHGNADPAGEARQAGRRWARALAAADRQAAAVLATAAMPRATGGVTQEVPGVVTPEAATAHLVRLMDRLGFAPRAAEPGAPIELHRCPFVDVAAEHTDVVCGVHLGLMQAALEELGAPLSAERLEPFAAPGICRAHVAVHPADGSAVPPARPATDPATSGAQAPSASAPGVVPTPPTPSERVAR